MIKECAFTVGERDKEHLCKDTGADFAEATKKIIENDVRTANMCP